MSSRFRSVVNALSAKPLATTTTSVSINGRLSRRSPAAFNETVIRPHRYADGDNRSGRNTFALEHPGPVRVVQRQRPRTIAGGIPSPRRAQVPTRPSADTRGHGELFESRQKFLREIRISAQLAPIPGNHGAAHKLLDPCNRDIVPPLIAFRSQNGSRFDEQVDGEDEQPAWGKDLLDLGQRRATSGSDRCSMVDMHRTASNFPVRFASGQRGPIQSHVGPEAPFSAACSVIGSTSYCPSSPSP